MFDVIKLLYKDLTSYMKGGPINTYEVGRFQDMYGSLSSHIKHLFSTANHYDGAKQGRLQNDWNPRIKTPTSALRVDRTTLISRAIDLDDNNSHAKGLMTVILNNVVGQGLRPFPRVKMLNGEPIIGINKILKEAWKRYNDQWAADKRSTQLESQSIRLRELIRSGSTITNIVKSNNPNSHLGISNQIVNVLRLDEMHDTFNESDFSQSKNVVKTVFGINMDKLSAPISYWIKGVKDPVPVEQMRVDYEVDIAEQFIGIPWLVTALKYLFSNDSLISDELVTSRIRSMISLIMPEAAIPSFVEKNKITSDGLINWESGSIITTKDANQTPQLIQPTDSIKDVLDPLQKLLLHAIAMTRGISYQALTSDLEKINMSSGRINTMRDELTFKILRKKFINMICKKDWNTFVFRMFAEGKMGSLTITDYLQDPWKYCEVQWRPQGKGMLDPYKETLAAKEQRSGWLLTMDDWFSNDGKEWQDQIDQNLTEIEYFITQANKKGFNIDFEKALQILGLDSSNGASFMQDKMEGEEDENGEKSENENTNRI